MSGAANASGRRSPNETPWCAWVVVLAALAALTPQRPAVAATPDMERGSRWPFAYTFTSQPPRATPAPGSACEVADAFMRGSGASLADLFAADAVFMGPYDILYRGPAEIVLWFGRPGAHDPGKPGEGPPKIIPLSYVDHGAECFVEVANLRPSVEPGKPDGYRLVAIDHFTVDADHKIKRLVIYLRPDPQADSVKQGLSHGRADWPVPPGSGQ